MQDVGGLLHLDHERRVATRDVVGCPYARVNTIDQSDLGARRRHERAGLGHQTDQCRLSQVR